MSQFFPFKSIFDFLQIPVFKAKETKFFYEVVMETLRQRKATKTR